MIDILKKLYCLSEKEQPYIRKSVVYGLLYSAFELLQFLAVYLVLRAVATHAEGNIPMQAFGIMLISIAGCIVMHAQSNIKQMRAGLYMAADKRIDIGNKLRHAAMGYFNDSSLGKITAAVSSKLYMIENTVPSILSNVLQGILYTAVLLVGFLCFQWKIGLIMVISAVLYCVIVQGMFRATQNEAPRKQQAVTKLIEGVLEYIQGIVIIRSFQDDNNRAEVRMKQVLNESRAAETSYEKKVMPYTVISQIILKCGSVLAMYVAVVMGLNGQIAVEKSALAVIWLFVIFNQLQLAGSMIAILQNVDTALGEIEESGNPPQLENGGETFTGETCDIAVNNICFSYEKKNVIDHVSLTIPQKTSTAIVGYSGSGKTTLCNLICRFWDVDSGSISIGGKDIRQYNTDQMLGNISVVFQNVYLFNDTIANNIRFGKPDATDEEMMDAAKRACCHDFIMQLPDQYNTVIGENGAALSGGEKQRISIARAMIKDAPIVILDEATSNIDPENEQLIQHAMEELTRDKTIIMIAHRLKTVRNADQIIVMNQGRIAQRGTHEQLMKQGGIYASLINVRTEALGWKLS